MSRSTWAHALSLVALAGCGGTHAETTPAVGVAASEPTPRASGDAMVPPETMDEITRSLARKRTVVARCLAIAVDNKELPRNAAGKITLEIVIAPGGRAELVKVVRATLESQSLSACVIRHVKDIQFPDLPRPYETSFTYGFEAM
jgi:hypothetical protein